AIMPMKANTIASAIKIGNPVNYPKAVRSIKWTNGVVEMVTDQEIMDAKALIDRVGIGCEPASACSLAGAKKLVDMGIIQPHETVVGILTGHVLKDPDATINYHRDQLANIRAQYPNQIHQANANSDEIAAILNREVEEVLTV
ncbi:MAG TPA: pyridoxal-phosphate dependent enzyme, partial [Aggregatilineales bacterium]|nr:pyridoxal-phosphate dependent enzyme [Aggregatilineales bacterium]